MAEVKIEPETFPACVPSIFDHQFFRNKPALAALKNVQEPKPELIRACLLEMARHLIRMEGNAK